MWYKSSKVKKSKCTSQRHIGERRYSSTNSWIWYQMGRMVSFTLSAALLPCKSPGTYQGGWMGPRAGVFIFREKINLLPLTAMEPQFLGRPVHSLVTADWAVRTAVNLQCLDHFCVRFLYIGQWSRVSVVSTVAKATRWVVRHSNPGRRQGNLYFTMFLLAKRPTQPPVRCVPGVPAAG